MTTEAARHIEKIATFGYQTDLVCRYVDGHTWVVTQEFVYASKRLNVVIRIPVGFETDFASVPRVAWRLLSPTDGCIGKAAVVHDYMYRTPGFPVTRDDADAELICGMELLGASWWKRQIVLAAVHIGGGCAYRPRVAPTPLEQKGIGI